MRTEATQALAERIDACMSRDRVLLRRLLRDARRADSPLTRKERRWGAPPHGQAEIERLVQEIERAEKRLADRAAGLPRLSYPDDLPICERKAEIEAAIAAHQVVVICGETGSGKSTQLPKMCLGLGRGVRGMIGHTQPRRIAARSIAGRLSQELGVRLGEQVGFKVRFHDRTRPSTLVKVVTDGMLLAETSADRDLLHYDTIIIDEAHERSLNIDLLIGYLHRLLPRRPDLKVIVTSATIDPDRFSKHFGGAPIIEVSGRTYPVEMVYRPAEASGDDDGPAPTSEAALVGAVDELCAHGQGDILVFFPGEREIREAAEALAHHRIGTLRGSGADGGTAGAGAPPVVASPGSDKGTGEQGEVAKVNASPQRVRTGRSHGRRDPSHRGRGAEIVPLYSRLSTEEQDRVFQPHGGRRIVLATNVAETSLTVPGIRYVIDTGLARINRYSPRQRVSRLPIEKISRASADQRAGRCGRIGPGVCIRLYSEEDYNGRPRHTDPEILRTSLAGVILQMKALGLGEIEHFPFLDAPEARRVREGYETLGELGAIDAEGRLTPLGRELAKLPTDCRIGRMILEARREDCLSEVLVIAAALSVQDPRERPREARQTADEFHARFADPQSDFGAYVNLWNWWHAQTANMSQNKARKLCRDSFLSYVRMREWIDVHHQLRTMTTESGMKLNPEPADADRVHRALLSGLLRHIAVREEPHRYTGADGAEVRLFPGSALFEHEPRWIMAAEMMRTTRLFARCCAKINPAWVEPLAGSLARRTYSDPFWHRATARVCAYETVTLYGLEVIHRRRVHLGPVDPVTARPLFITHALIEGETEPQPAFVRHNREVCAQARTVAAKMRRGDVLAEHADLLAFYDSRIPTTVYCGAGLEQWRRRADDSQKRALFMGIADALKPGVAPPESALYPDEVMIGDSRCPIAYAHEPGEPADGITLTVPLEALNQVESRRLDWLAPGMLPELIVTVIRSLPKDLRRGLTPAVEVAERCAAALRPLAPAGKDATPRDLYAELARMLGKEGGAAIAPEALRAITLPDHLRVRLRVVDDKGNELACSRDAEEVRDRLRPRLERALMAARGGEFAREGLTAWDIGDLPESVRFERPGCSVLAYPALVDMGASVSLRVFDSPHGAAVAHRAGLRRLFLLQMPREVESLIRATPGLDRLALLYKPFGDAKAFRDDLAGLISDRAFLGEAEDVRTKAEFSRRLEAGWNRLTDSAHWAGDMARRILESAQAAHMAFATIVTPSAAHALEDVRTQLRLLLPPRFLTATPGRWLPHLPRFLDAARLRLEKLSAGGVMRDARQSAEVSPLWAAALERLSHRSEGLPPDPALEEYRWMIEELRVSLFAQELGTSAPVSVKRLEKLWEKVR